MPNTPRDPESLVFIDQTIYANEDNSARVKWKNSEVLEMLLEIRARVVEDLEPPLFTLPASSTLNEGTPT